MKIAVCVSGGGTNLQAISDKINSGEIHNTEIAVVISNNFVRNDGCTNNILNSRPFNSMDTGSFFSP